MNEIWVLTDDAKIHPQGNCLGGKKQVHMMMGKAVDLSWGELIFQTSDAQNCFGLKN